MDFVSRLTLINSITGYKPANLVGTINDNHQTNLAIFSSVVHLGSDPALIGFVMRPLVAERHTLENIRETGCYTINHIHFSMAKKAHFTSADLPRESSEFDRCALTAEYLHDFRAPFVKESKIKIGLQLADLVPLAINHTTLVIGHVEHIIMDRNYILPDNRADLETAGTVCIAGIDTYCKAESQASYPYATTDNIPLSFD